MNFKDSIRYSLGVADFFLESYLGDLTAAEMLVRPVPEANHVAWQLGHLIAAENRLVEAAVPGSMPALPEGFAERHKKETAASDNPVDFLSKGEYFKLAKATRAATLQVLDRLSEADLDRPVSGRVPPFVTKAGECFGTIAGHWTLHAGQWAVLRRKLSRERKF